jgi:hypothetical protein
MDANNCDGIVGNAGIIERQAGGPAESGTTMVSSIPRGLREDGHEGMDPPKKIIGDLHQDGEKCLLDQQEVIIHGRPRVIPSYYHSANTRVLAEW